MYTETKTAKALEAETVKEQIKILAEGAIKNKYGTAKQRAEMKEGLNESDGHTISMFAKQLCELNAALISGASVFAICEKQPRGNLDTGKHYYSVHYTKDNQVHKFWARGFTYLVGADIQERDRNLDKFIFSSGAIGMSRLLDATDQLFCLLRSLGGAYSQIDCK